MINLLLSDSSKVTAGTFEGNLVLGHSSRLWLYISIIELIIIIYLFYIAFLKKPREYKRNLRKEAFEKEIDFNNIINSSFNSIQLYNELKIKCHPDRFPLDSKKNLEANLLFQEITRSKTNIKRLLELKEEAIKKLDINL